MEWNKPELDSEGSNKQPDGRPVGDRRHTIYDGGNFDEGEYPDTTVEEDDGKQKEQTGDRSEQ